MEKKKNEIIDGKMLPNNYEAEQAVLSCTLIDGESALMVVSKLEEIDFYNETHRYIFRAIKSLFKNSIPIDFVSVNDKLEQLGLSNTVGGISYISSLSTLVPSSAGCSHYIEIVKRESILRQLIQASGGIIEKAYDPDADTNLIGVAEKAIYDIAEKWQNGALEKLTSLHKE